MPEKHGSFPSPPIYSFACCLTKALAVRGGGWGEVTAVDAKSSNKGGKIVFPAGKQFMPFPCGFFPPLLKRFLFRPPYPGL